MVRSAATLVRERGVHGVGMREIVAHSGGPRGSLQHYFPGGKAQVLTEALDVTVADLSADVNEGLAQAATLPDAIAVILEHDFAQGCPLAATVIDAADNDELRTHVSELLARWQASVSDVFVKFGAPRTEANDQSTVLLAAIEGALVLARARRSTEPLDLVERHFTTPTYRRACDSSL
jgi:AcrR family transcriptional regulator